MLCLVDFPGKTDLFLKKNGGGVDLGKREHSRKNWEELRKGRLVRIYCMTEFKIML